MLIVLSPSVDCVVPSCTPINAPLLSSTCKTYSLTFILFNKLSAETVVVISAVVCVVVISVSSTGVVNESISSLLVEKLKFPEVASIFSVSLHVHFYMQQF